VEVTSEHPLYEATQKQLEHAKEIARQIRENGKATPVTVEVNGKKVQFTPDKNDPLVAHFLKDKAGREAGAGQTADPVAHGESISPHGAKLAPTRASLSGATLNAIRDSKAIGSYQSPSGAVIVQYVFNNKSDAEALLHHLNKDNPHDQSTNILHRPRGTPESEPYVVQVKSEKAKAFGLLPENLTYDELVAGVKPSQSINLKGVEWAGPPVAKNPQQNTAVRTADPVVQPANSGRPQSRVAKAVGKELLSSHHEAKVGTTFNLAQMVYGDYTAFKQIVEHGPDKFSMGMLGANKGLLGASLAHAHCTKGAVAKLLELSAKTGNEEAKQLAQEAVLMLQNSRPKTAAELLEKLAKATKGTEVDLLTKEATSFASKA